MALTDIPRVFGYLNEIISFLISLIPYTIVWFMFAFLIIFMPNRRISFKAGIYAGIISGTMYQLILNFYIRLQVTVSVYNIRAQKIIILHIVHHIIRNFRDPDKPPPTAPV